MLLLLGQRVVRLAERQAEPQEILAGGERDRERERGGYRWRESERERDGRREIEMEGQGGRAGREGVRVEGGRGAD